MMTRISVLSSVPEPFMAFTIRSAKYIGRFFTLIAATALVTVSTALYKLKKIEKKYYQKIAYMVKMPVPMNIV